MGTVLERPVPLPIREIVNRATAILKEGGCAEVYEFGETAEGVDDERDDVHIAVRGCPNESFFDLLGSLLLSLRRSVDMVDLDTRSALAEYLQREGRLVRVA